MNLNTATLIILGASILLMQVLDMKQWEQQRALNASLVDVEGKIIGVLHHHLTQPGAEP